MIHSNVTHTIWNSEDNYENDSTKTEKKILKKEILIISKT